MNTSIMVSEASPQELTANEQREINVNPQPRSKARDRLCACDVRSNSFPGRKRISCTRFFAFSTFFGRGLKAKMEVRNEGKYLKIGEVENEW